MPIFSLSLIFCFVVILSLMSIHFVNRQMIRKRLVASKLQELSNRVVELEEIALSLMPLLGNQEIPMIILDEQIDTIHKMQQMSKRAHIMHAFDAAQQQQHDLRNKPVTQNRALQSDAVVARAHVQLNEAANVLLRRKKGGHINEDLFKYYIDQLSWTKLMTSIVSLIMRGLDEQKKHTAANNTTKNTNDLRSSALEFFKKALKHLENASIEDPRKKALSYELREIIEKKRAILSEDLVPEAQHI